MSKEYVSEYRNKFLFEKDSHTFREIIYKAAIQYLEAGNGKCGIATFDTYVQAVNNLEEVRVSCGTQAQKYKDLNQEVQELSKDVYDKLIKTDDNGSGNEDENSKNIKTIKDYLHFYGAVEKDFSSIINPNEAGLTQFWRVINYFWSAFFTISEPLCRNFEWYSELPDKKQKFYRYVLSNLDHVLKSVYNNFDYATFENLEKTTGNYYKTISTAYPKSFAFTTNYTPFVGHYFRGRCSYLAGKLSEFEFPTELCIKNVEKCSIGSKDFVFPFLMTQAPVKPIVVPDQIREYSLTIRQLSQADTLVIIGYSLGKADNHINAILREFALKKGKRIVYCYYSADKSQEYKKSIEMVRSALKLDNNSGCIDAIWNNGDAVRLTERLKKCCKLLKMEMHLCPNL